MFVRGDVEKSALEAALGSFPAAQVFSREGFIEDRSAFVGQFLNMVYVLLALSVVVSLFGMVNTLVLSVFERTRELGMLRAVGMTRRQVRQMVRHESVIVALIGAATGTPARPRLSARRSSVGSPTTASPTTCRSRRSSSSSRSRSSPASEPRCFPARRASRLNILQALQYE